MTHVNWWQKGKYYFKIDLLQMKITGNFEVEQLLRIVVKM